MSGVVPPSRLSPASPPRSPSRNPPGEHGHQQSASSPPDSPGPGTDRASEHRGFLGNIEASSVHHFYTILHILTHFYTFPLFPGRVTDRRPYGRRSVLLKSALSNDADLKSFLGNRWIPFGNSTLRSAWGTHADLGQRIMYLESIGSAPRQAAGIIHYFESS